MTTTKDVKAFFSFHEETGDFEFTDVAQESVCARWSSLAAPLMPSLLLSKEASSTLFRTPWREKSGLASCARSAALHVLSIFEDDLECQTSWVIAMVRSCQSCMQLSATEVICWTWSFVMLMATLVGASSVSSLLGIGFAVRRMYLLGCARSFLSFLAEALSALEVGPRETARASICSKARAFALSTLASALLPSNVLATHLTTCLVFGLMERLVDCLFRLAAPARALAEMLKDMGAGVASRIVDAVLTRFSPTRRLAELQAPLGVGREASSEARAPPVLGALHSNPEGEKSQEPGVRRKPRPPPIVTDRIIVDLSVEQAPKRTASHTESQKETYEEQLRTGS